MQENEKRVNEEQEKETIGDKVSSLSSAAQSSPNPQISRKSNM